MLGQMSGLCQATAGESRGRVTAQPQPIAPKMVTSGWQALIPQLGGWAPGWNRKLEGGVVATSHSTQVVYCDLSPATWGGR